MKLFLRSILIISIIFSYSSCKKYLDIKSVQLLATPSSLKDLELMFDNIDVNRSLLQANIGTDEYYLNYTDWQTRSDNDKNGYIWLAELDNYGDWEIQYKIIYITNTVLYNLPLVSNENNSDQYKSILGSALFLRSHAFFELSQLFGPQYDFATATTTLGIPLRLDPDFNKKSTRANLQETYNQIITDLNKSIELLPAKSLMKTRPSKVAAYGLLARVYLQVGNYKDAKITADNYLDISNTLLDFNDKTWVDPTSVSAPIKKPLNPEVEFYTNTDGPVNANQRARIDSNLYKMFADNDLRKTVYFTPNSDGSYRFKGSYNVGSENLFNGIATDEIFLLRAEAFARMGNYPEALKDLNKLLEKRWRTGTFSQVYAASSVAALDSILIERRKECIYRGLRWSDLRRLNKEARYATTIKRVLNGTTYELKPDDLRYTNLIPVNVITLTSLPQNAR